MKSTNGATLPVAGTSTILVVDDHRYVRDMVRALFETQGYRVLEAADGDEAITLAQRHRPDCVLLDVRMPGKSGFDVLDHLSQDPRTRETPVIMLTASDDTLDGMDRALRGGAVDYLTKPIAPARVAIRVRGAIERYRLLREVQDLRANFTSMLVHDLRSPITVINAYADLLGQGGAGSVSDRQRQVLLRIQESCDRMVELIGQILDVSRLEAGKPDLERKVMDLGAVVADVTERFGPGAQSKGVTLTLTRPDDPCFIDADPRRLDQVLMNLVANALKFTRRGDKICVDVARDGGEVEASVTDSGPGIAREELPLLFERFSRTSSARALATPGTGLGLVICRHLVEAHGGRIWAESDLGRGARFVLRLPAVAPAAAARDGENGTRARAPG